MKRMKKMIACSMTMVCCLSALAGCSGGSGNAAGGDTAGTTAVSGETAAGGASGGNAASQSGAWNPDRSITMLVPWSAGGGADLSVRTLVPYLEDDLGVSITVVNSTGANGWIAWNELLNADPDGYTIAQMNIPTVYSGYMDPQQNRDNTLDDFALVANEVSDWWSRPETTGSPIWRASSLTAWKMSFWPGTTAWEPTSIWWRRT